METPSTLKVFRNGEFQEARRVPSRMDFDSAEALREKMSELADWSGGKMVILYNRPFIAMPYVPPRVKRARVGDYIFQDSTIIAPYALFKHFEYETV